jgi:type III secretion protein L
MARVIKADASARIVPRVVADAGVHARELIATAQAEVEVLRDAARELGRAEGRAEFAGALLELERAHAQALQALEQQALEVALLAARRIVGDALALEPQRIAGIVTPLLARLRRARGIVLRVHPEDVAALEAALAAAIDHGKTREAIRVEGDPGVSRGGCIASSDVGTLDARVETQLAAIERALQTKPT